MPISDCLLSSHLTLAVQMKSKTHGGKRKGGLSFLRLAVQRKCKDACVCGCVCVFTGMHQKSQRQILCSCNDIPAFRLHKFFFLLLCTNEWPPNVCAVIIMNLG